MRADIIWLASTDSTNEEAKRRISDIDNLSVVSALEQTQGRGQRGNTWSSNTGENLTFSLILKSIGIQARNQFILTEFASLSIVEFLVRHGIEAHIKWPNDIYVGSGKICGILIENSIRGDHISESIIGIGLNINQRNFEEWIPNPTSMSLCTKETTFDIRLCLEELTDIFRTNAELYIRNQQSTELNKLRDEYISRLWLKDEQAVFNDIRESKEFKGIIRNISPVGHLLVEDIEKGELIEFAFKEIAYMI